MLSFAVDPETLALFREATAELRRDARGPLSEEAALVLMTRQVLGGPTDDGHSSYRIASDVCESAAHVGARATQSIPPTLRRQVLRRDRHCCMVPGCRHATFIDVHHLRLRSEGGVHDPDELVTLCGAHHMALHKRHLSVEGTVATGLRFRHAAGSPYGQVESRLVAERQTKAFAALRQLGFREGVVKRALGQLRARDDLRDLESVLRAALLLLVPPQPPRHGPYGRRLSGRVEDAGIMSTRPTWALKRAPARRRAFPAIRPRCCIT